MKKLLISLKTSLSIVLNTEEIELLRMEAYREDLRAQRERNDKSLIRSKDFKPIELRQKSTVPEPFNLLTSRIRLRNLLTSEDKLVQEIKNRPKFKARANPYPKIQSKQLKAFNTDLVFKAKPMPNFSIPFTPKLGLKRPCRPLKLRLHTMQRAESKDFSIASTSDSTSKSSIYFSEGNKK